MSLRITHLNGDTSFLLTFSPTRSGGDASTTELPSPGPVPGTFTILVDPWLSPAPMTVLSPRFAATSRVVPASVESLADLPAVDLVLISQDKPDHCHRETLVTLPSSSRTTILGAPPAAKRIRSWRHFDASTVHALRRYDSTKPEETLWRHEIPALAPGGEPGEVTVAYVAPRADMTGMHQALGITYRPPSTADAKAAFINLPNLPLTPPVTPPPSTSMNTNISRKASTASSARTPTGDISFPLSPSTLRNRNTPLSVLYSPHGVPWSYVQAYAASHLVSTSALPLTALFHSFTRTTNPWFLGGNVTAGAADGLHIARALQPAVWVSAHDEDKASTGVAVRALKVEKCEMENVRQALELDDEKTRTSSSRVNIPTRLVQLDSGEDCVVDAHAPAVISAPTSPLEVRRGDAVSC